MLGNSCVSRISRDSITGYNMPSKLGLVLIGARFLLDPFRGEILFVRLFVCLSVYHHFLFYRYLGIGRSNPKISKNKVHFFSNFASERNLPTQSTRSPTHSTGPQKLFFTDISVSVAQIEKK